MRAICNVGLLLATAMSAPAFSQETKVGDQPGEIVVTAQKREQKLQDIGLSISAIGGEQLGSGLTDQSQKMTVAARAMAEKKALGHRS